VKLETLGRTEDGSNGGENSEDEERTHTAVLGGICVTSVTPLPVLELRP